LRSQPVFRPARYWRDITVTLLRHVLSGWLSDGSLAPGWCCGEAARGSVSPTAVGVCYHLRRCSVASCALSSMLYSTGVIAYFGMVLAYCVYGVGLLCVWCWLNTWLVTGGRCVVLVGRVVAAGGGGLLRSLEGPAGGVGCCRRGRWMDCTVASVVRCCCRCGFPCRYRE